MRNYWTLWADFISRVYRRKYGEEEDLEENNSVAIGQ